MPSNLCEQCARAALWVALIGLFGCTVAPRPDAAPVAALWRQHSDQVRRIKVWQLRGRLSLSTPDKSWRAGLRWQQQADRFSLRVIAPWGQGSYELESQGQGAALRAANNRVYRAANAEALLEQHLGWRLNLDGLRYWIRGLPDPRATSQAMRWDTAGRLVGMEQHGFQVRILRYRSQADVALPAKLFIEGNGIQLRVLVQSWEL